MNMVLALIIVAIVCFVGGVVFEWYFFIHRKVT